MSILEDNEFMRLEETEHDFILTDKVLEGREVIHQGETETVLNIAMDFVDVDGRLCPVKTYYPKGDLKLKQVEDIFRKMTTRRAAEKRKLESLHGRT